jgi:hypothetical protein
MVEILENINKASLQSNLNPAPQMPAGFFLAIIVYYFLQIWKENVILSLVL